MLFHCNIAFNDWNETHKDVFKVFRQLIEEKVFPLFSIILEMPDQLLPIIDK